MSSFLRQMYDMIEKIPGPGRVPSAAPQQAPGTGQPPMAPPDQQPMNGQMGMDPSWAMAAPPQRDTQNPEYQRIKRGVEGEPRMDVQVGEPKLLGAPAPRAKVEVGTPELRGPADSGMPQTSIPGITIKIPHHLAPDLLREMAKNPRK